MKLTDVNTRTLTALLSLTKKKESLMAKIAEVDKQIASLASGEAQAAIRVLRAKTRRGRKPTAKRSKPKSRSPKGWIEQEIKKVLQEVGDAGASVREIAEKIGKPVQNIHVWFSGTGRKTGLFEKTEQGRFRFKKA